MLSGIKLDSSSIINTVTITLFSKYKTMTAKHRFQQPGRVLESKLLKHIKNASYDDKINKYKFLTLEYELLFYNYSYRICLSNYISARLLSRESIQLFDRINFTISCISISLLHSSISPLVLISIIISIINFRNSLYFSTFKD